MERETWHSGIWSEPKLKGRTNCCIRQPGRDARGRLKFSIVLSANEHAVIKRNMFNKPYLSRLVFLFLLLAQIFGASLILHSDEQDSTEVKPSLNPFPNVLAIAAFPVGFINGLNSSYDALGPHPAGLILISASAGFAYSFYTNSIINDQKVAYNTRKEFYSGESDSFSKWLKKKFSTSTIEPYFGYQISQFNTDLISSKKGRIFGLRLGKELTKNLLFRLDLLVEEHNYFIEEIIVKSDIMYYSASMEVKGNMFYLPLVLVPKFKISDNIEINLPIGVGYQIESLDEDYNRLESFEEDSDLEYDYHFWEGSWRRHLPFRSQVGIGLKWYRLGIEYTIQRDLGEVNRHWSSVVVNSKLKSQNLIISFDLSY